MQRIAIAVGLIGFMAIGQLHASTNPLIDTTRERRDMWYLKRYGLPYMYWHAILTGRM